MPKYSLGDVIGKDGFHTPEASLQVSTDASAITLIP